jgi:hypothetical protein
LDLFTDVLRRNNSAMGKSKGDKGDKSAAADVKPSKPKAKNGEGSSLALYMGFACAVAVRDDPWRGQWPTHPALDVRRIDAGDMHANPYLTGSRDRVGSVPDGQDVLGIPIAFVPGCAHFLVP